MNDSFGVSKDELDFVEQSLAQVDGRAPMGRRSKLRAFVALRATGAVRGPISDKADILSKRLATKRN